MNLKTKIKTILPLWGIGLGLCLLFLLISRVWETSKFSALTQAHADTEAKITTDQPQVLGESIDLRGQPNPTIPIPTLVGNFDDSDISANSYLIAEANTGKIITSKNSTHQELIASLTKLMTGLVAYKQSDLTSFVTLNGNDEFNISPVLRLQPGDSVKLLDLFNAMLVGSDNDAALALANHVESLSGNNFVGLMNQTAQSLAMENSKFSNALGFDSPNNYSTAEDLLKLVRETQKYAVFSQMSKNLSYDFSGSMQKPYHATATDKLVAKYPEIYAIKTGFTQGAGQAMITKISQDEHTLIIIVLDSKDREADTLKLKNEAFNHIVWQ